MNVNQEDEEIFLYLIIFSEHIQVLDDLLFS